MKEKPRLSLNFKTNFNQFVNPPEIICERLSGDEQIPNNQKLPLLKRVSQTRSTHCQQVVPRPVRLFSQASQAAIVSHNTYIYSIACLRRFLTQKHVMSSHFMFTDTFFEIF